MVAWRQLALPPLALFAFAPFCYRGRAVHVGIKLAGFPRLEVTIV